MVPDEGLEPPRLTTLAPKASVSANFTNLAWCFRLVTIQLPSALQTDALPFELQKQAVGVLALDDDGVTASGTSKPASPTS